MKKRKFLALSLAAALVCGTFTGCVSGLNRPKSASEVVEKYVAMMEDSCNYHANMDMAFDISAKAQGISIDLPISMELSADVMDKNLHGDMTLSMTLMEEDMKQTMEVYVVSDKDNTTTYAYDSESDYWTVSEDNDEGAGLAFSFADMDGDDFKDATLESNKNTGGYTVTQSFADFSTTGNTYDMLEDIYGGMSEMMNMDSDDFLEEWEKADVVYEFNKDCYLTSVAVENCEYSGTIKEDGENVDVKVSLDLSFEFSDYGDVKESDVEVPDDVVENAVPSLTMDLDDSEFGDWDEYPGYDEEESSEYESQDEDIDYTAPASPDEGEELDPGFSVDPVESDVLGSYNGTPITCQNDSWDIFGDDGWKLEDNTDLSFITATNPKYEDVDFYVWNKSRTHTTSSEIKRDGFFGYNIDCAYTDKFPPMTFNGITFGDTADKVIAAYGSNYDLYEGTMYNAYSYELTDDIEITLYVYPDKGLREVQLNFYGGL